MAEKNTVEYWELEINITQDKIKDLLLGNSSGIKSSKSGDDEITEHSLREQVDALYRYISYCEEKKQEAGAKSNKIGILFIDRDCSYGI